jgi:hypothetical protein
MDASCVSLPVDQYDWVLDDGDTWQRVVVPNGAATFVYTWSSCPNDPANLIFRLTVSRGASSSTASKSVLIAGGNLKAEPSTGTPMLQFQTHLSVPPFDGQSRGRILLEGGLSRIVDSSAPVTVQAPVASGKHRIEAVMTRGGSEPGRWRFDFAQEPRLVRGSLRVQQGNVEAVDGSAIVFRVSGSSGERLAFNFDLEP